jgi:sigma-B regulation protein RsbU (phosphoserine phosphatase)
VANVLVGAIKRKRTEQSLFQKEGQLIAAQAIQRRLLPKAPPQLPGFDIAAGWYPSEMVSGDYFDYLPMPDRSMALVVGDVTGHGLAPALLTASTQSLIHLLVHAQTDVGEILAKANSILVEGTEDDRFVTLLLGKLDSETRSFSYASAGHPAGYVLDASGAVKARLDSTSLPLAVLPDVEYSVGSPVDLQDGDVVLLLTDGVFEAASSRGEPFGMRRVLDVVRQNLHCPSREICETLHQAVKEFCGFAEPTDDMTTMVVKVLAKG